METSTTALTPAGFDAAHTTPSTSAMNLYTRLNTEWMHLCERPSATAEVLTWHTTQPALADIAGLDDLAAAHRSDRDGVLLALLVLHQEGSTLAGRALLQLMLGKLISITRHARVTSYDRYHAYDERAAATVAAFMSMAATYRPTGSNIYAALFLHTLKQIARPEPFADEIPASDYLDQAPDVAEHSLDSDLSAPALLLWAVANDVINELDRTLIQRAYLEKTDCDLAAIAAEFDLTPAALRQRLSRALGRIRKQILVSHRQSTVRPRYARKPYGSPRENLQQAPR